MTTKKVTETALVPWQHPDLEVTLAADVSSADALKAVESVCTAIDERAKSLSFLRTVLGRFVRDIQERELYKPAFTTFEAYTQHLDEKWNLSRSVTRDALQFVRAFPKLEPEEAADIPVANQTLAARAAKKVSDPKQLRALIKDARQLTIVQYREKLEEGGLVARRGRPDGGSKKKGPVTLRIVLSARAARRLREQAGDRDLGKFIEELLALAEGTQAA